MKRFPSVRHFSSPLSAMSSLLICVMVDEFEYLTLFERVWQPIKTNLVLEICLGDVLASDAVENKLTLPSCNFPTLFPISPSVDLVTRWAANFPRAVTFSRLFSPIWEGRTCKIRTETTVFNQSKPTNKIRSILIPVRYSHFQIFFVPFCPSLLK